MTSWESAASALFARQHALATTHQLAEIGVPRGVIRQRRRTGEWLDREPGLVALPGPDSWERRLHGAVLLGGRSAIAAAGTAGRAYGFDGFDRYDELVVTSIDGAHVRRASGARVLRSAQLTSRHRLVLPNGIPVVSKPVALVQIAAEHGTDTTAQALDGLLRDGVSARWIDTTARDLRRSGVRGPALVQQLLHERVDARLPRSWFQRLAKRLLAATGLVFVDELPVVSPTERRLAVLDLALPSLKIGVECQSWSFHGTPAAQARDNRRRRALRGLGWEIVDVWWSDLHRMDDVLSDVLVVLDRQRPMLPGFG